MSPSGLIQSILEWLHIGVDLPWWGCIAIGKFS
jgi:YidC/Oxa1 family membrane protein insertase